MTLPSEIKSAEELDEIFVNIVKMADHCIPFYAYGDNQAACEMSDRLGKITKLVEAMREQSSQRDLTIWNAAIEKAAEVAKSKFQQHFNGSKVIAGCEICDDILNLKQKE